MTELISVSPDVMGGVPRFAGTRVPLAVVLAALDAGESFERVLTAYPFLTPAHVTAASDFAAIHELGRPRRLDKHRSGWQLVKEKLVRTGGGRS